MYHAAKKQKAVPIGGKRDQHVSRGQKENRSTVPKKNLKRQREYGKCKTRFPNCIWETCFMLPRPTFVFQVFFFFFQP